MNNNISDNGSIFYLPTILYANPRTHLFITHIFFITASYAVCYNILRLVLKSINTTNLRMIFLLAVKFCVHKRAELCESLGVSYVHVYMCMFMRVPKICKLYSQLEI